MIFDYENILIFGYEKSGHAVENVLKDVGVNYKIYDKKIKISGGNFISKLSIKILKKFDLIVLSPGVSIYKKYVKMADILGIKVIGELEFGFWFTSADIIAITGTNGKTTVTNMITEVLKCAGYKTDCYGNIGNPLSNAYKKEYDYIVCEVSSFQLESTDKFAPKISVLLNISEDHIDRHKSYKNYIECKKSIFKNCNTNDSVVIGKKCEHFVNCDEISTNNVIKFDSIDGEICQKEGDVYINNEKVVKINKKLQEFTYFDNILAVVSVMKILNIDFEIINKCNFDKKIPHRFDTFLKHKGITYIDDSKATNPDSTLFAVQNLKGNIILLLGGLNKKNKFDNLIKNISKNIKKFVLFGNSAKEISKTLKKNKIPHNSFKTLELATDYVVSVVEKNDIVLLSPACASFDEFLSYAERGDYFQKYIKDRVLGNEK